MKNLINFFFSFDKLMKHKLVPLFFWATLIFGAIYFAREILGWTFFTEWIADLTYIFQITALAIMGFVGLRLVCELAIAIFRISDNLSPDGGASDLADIDPLEETRRAAEEAAKRAREVTGKAVDATKSTASNIKDSAEKRFNRAGDSSAKPKPKPSTNPVEQVFDRPVEIPEPAPAPKPAAKKAPAKKTTSTKSTPSSAKKTTAKKSTTTKKPAAKKTSSTSKKSTTKKTTPKKPPTKTS